MTTIESWDTPVRNEDNVPPPYSDMAEIYEAESGLWGWRCECGGECAADWDEADARDCLAGHLSEIHEEVPK